MFRFLPPFMLLIASAGAISGCARLDTYNRPYTWHPTGANLANIAAQAAHPGDLVLGHGDDRADAAELVPAIQQVDGGASGATAGGGGNAAAAGGGAAPGGAGSGSGSGASGGGG